MANKTEEIKLTDFPEGEQRKELDSIAKRMGWEEDKVAVVQLSGSQSSEELRMMIFSPIVRKLDEYRAQPCACGKPEHQNTPEDDSKVVALAQSMVWGAGVGLKAMGFPTDAVIGLFGNALLTENPLGYMRKEVGGSPNGRVN